MKISSEGLIHLSAQEFLATPLVHFFSGVDQDVAASIQQCGTVAPISGYTEWVNLCQPTISVGWDWHLLISEQAVKWTRIGLPRTNIILLDDHSNAFDWNSSLVKLATLVDSLPWQAQVAQSLAA